MSEYNSTGFADEAASYVPQPARLSEWEYMHYIPASCAEDLVGIKARNAVKNKEFSSIDLSPDWYLIRASFMSPDEVNETQSRLEDVVWDKVARTCPDKEQLRVAIEALCKPHCPELSAINGSARGLKRKASDSSDASSGMFDLCPDEDEMDLDMEGGEAGNRPRPVPMHPDQVRNGHYQVCRRDQLGCSSILDVLRIWF